MTQRFLNADRQIAGVGTSTNGYNLFSYCFNNPVNMTDSTGNWPTWNDIKNGVKKVFSKAKDVVKKVFSAFTLEFGLGMGLKGGADVGGVTVDVGMKSDSITGILNSEQSKLGQRQEGGLRVSVGPVAIGPLQSDWVPVTKNDTYETEFTWINDVSVLEYGVEFYFMYGFTINLSIDLEVLSEGVVMIFE